MNIQDAIKLEKKIKREELENSLYAQIKAYKLPIPDRQYKFCPTRKWRLDFYWKQYNLAVEVEGGIWINGGHNRGVGFAKDIEKYNQLSLDGIVLLRFHADQIKSGEAVQFIEQYIKKNEVKIWASA